MVRRIKLSLPELQQLHDGKARVELGCGQQTKSGYIGLDAYDHGQEIVWDIHEGIPLPDDSCANIYSSHTFEHIRPEYIITLFNACWRILKKDGELYVVVPSINNPKAYIPSHLTFFTKKSFEYFCGTISDTFDLDHMNYQSGGEVLRPWKMIELVENERGDIHCKLTPLK